MGCHFWLWGTICNWSETDRCVGFDAALNNNKQGTDRMSLIAIMSFMWMDLQDNGM